MSSDKTSIYMENYNVLKSISEKLETQEIADIDKILPDIDKASKAYAVCMERIKKVKEVLDKSEIISN